MKSFIILLLAAALAASAFFTKPSEADFQKFATEKMSAEDGGNLIEQFTKDMRIKAFLKDCTYKDRYLWADVQKDGKTVYTGAFSHWIPRKTATQ